MLEHITILKFKDLGQLTEIMLFYGKVTVFIDENQLASLFKQVHPNIFIPFIEEHKESIELKYLDSGVSAYENIKFPDSIYFCIANEMMVGDIPFLEQLFVENKDLTHRLVDLISKEDIQHKYFNDIFVNGLIADEIEKFFQGYIKRFRPPRLRRIPSDLFINVENGFLDGIYNPLASPLGYSLQQTNGFTVKIQAKKELSIQEIRCIKDMFRLFISTMAELPVWARASSELLSNKKESFAIKNKINYLVNLQTKSEKKIDSFQDVFISDTRDLRKVINSGEKSFLDYTKLYERSRKFRHWTSNLPADSNLLHEYYNAVISDNWIEKLPTKMARWILFTSAGLALDTLGAGGLGTLAGVTLGAVDTFLLDRLIGNWKPNHFIDRDVRRFVENSQK